MTNRGSNIINESLIIISLIIIYYKKNVLRIKINVTVSAVVPVNSLFWKHSY